MDVFTGGTPDHITNPAVLKQENCRLMRRKERPEGRAATASPGGPASNPCRCPEPPAAVANIGGSGITWCHESKVSKVTMSIINR